MVKKFRTQYNKEKEVFDPVSAEEHELHDSLVPLSVGEQVARFSQSGEIFAQTRRRELASLRGFDFEPEDAESMLDKEHITPADVLDAQRAFSNAVKAKKNSGRKAVEKPEVTASQATTTEQLEAHIKPETATESSEQ